MFFVVLDLQQQMSVRTMPPITAIINRPTISRHVAVIGAGAAGLVAARELRREGHSVVVFERCDQVGGTWVYTPKVDSDPLGSDPHRAAVHSSLYQSLRTNLPREVMGFRDYPFVDRGEERESDCRRYPGHREVLMYLKDFSRDFGICELVRFETEVLSVSRENGGKWNVRSRNREIEVSVDEIYDAVVICNGHYTEPRIAPISGISTWPGKQMHSHNYRLPDPFRDQVVVLIGNAASAVDISQDIARVAKEVHVSSRSAPDASFGQGTEFYTNIWLHPLIESVHEDGSVVFEDGTVIVVDVILHCTGYKYHFPFLENDGVVNVDDNRVGPLYEHIFPPALAPFLSFVGLPWKVVPFPLFEFQSRWIARVLSNRVLLPSPETMMANVETFYAMLDASSTPKRYTHNMSTYQFEYNDWVAEQCGSPATEKWRRKMYSAASKNKRDRPLTYRDEWDDHDLIAEAKLDFKNCSTKVELL